jgi:hypothetical protein
MDKDKQVVWSVISGQCRAWGVEKRRRIAWVGGGRLCVCLGGGVGNGDSGRRMRTRRCDGDGRSDE